ncbi:MAG: peptidoglycan-binding protein [Actinobacteria bacterium]|nr:peptidoglycan-binding protein [Actinomycetota bacterium]
MLLVPGQASAKKKSWSFGERTLKQGHKGKDVRSLQRYLTRAGIETGADGVFGTGTKTSVRTFERAQRRKVDGKVTRTDARVVKDVAVNGGAVASASTGGALPKNTKMVIPKPAEPPPLVLGPGDTATVRPDGLAVAPASAPPVVQAVIEAGNKIAKMPYIYGGGHGKWEDSGYDCSGSVSYALHGGGLLDASMPSGGFVSWGDAGPGQWITIYANGGHMYMVVAGLRFDTSGRASAGTRWQPASGRSGKGYTVRHPPGL